MKAFIKSIDTRMLFGFGLLLVLATLAVIIALGKVHQESSYGLDMVLGGLLTLAGGFAQWAFSTGLSKNKENKIEGNLTNH